METTVTVVETTKPEVTDAVTTVAAAAEKVVESAEAKAAAVVPAVADPVSPKPTFMSAFRKMSLRRTGHTEVKDAAAAMAAAAESAESAAIEAVAKVEEEAKEVVAKVEATAKTSWMKLPTISMPHLTKPAVETKGKEPAKEEAPKEAAVVEKKEEAAPAPVEEKKEEVKEAAPHEGPTVPLFAFLSGLTGKKTSPPPVEPAAAVEPEAPKVEEVVEKPKEEVVEAKEVTDEVKPAAAPADASSKWTMPHLTMPKFFGEKKAEPTKEEAKVEEKEAAAPSEEAKPEEAKPEAVVEPAAEKSKEEVKAPSPKSSMLPTISLPSFSFFKHEAKVATVEKGKEVEVAVPEAPKAEAAVEPAAEKPKQETTVEKIEAGVAEVIQEVETVAGEALAAVTTAVAAPTKNSFFRKLTGMGAKEVAPVAAPVAAPEKTDAVAAPEPEKKPDVVVEKKADAVEGSVSGFFRRLSLDRSKRPKESEITAAAPAKDAKPATPVAAPASEAPSEPGLILGFIQKLSAKPPKPVESKPEAEVTAENPAEATQAEAEESPAVVKALPDVPKVEEAVAVAQEVVAKVEEKKVEEKKAEEKPTTESA